MNLLRNIPIKRKLTLITMCASGVALLLACAGFVIYEQVTFRRSMARDLTVLTDMFDDNVAPGLTFNDPKSIELTLKSLDAHSRILAAAVYDKEGKLVAAYQRANLAKALVLPPVRSTGTHFESDRLDAFRSIVLAGETIGTIYIASDLKEIDARFKRYAVMVTVLLGLASLAAFGLSAKLRHVISDPVFHLARIASAVATDRNYAVRATKHNDDELGRLVDSFNDMLNQIQTQDSALRDARDKLEERVQERTRELKSEILERQRSEQALRDSNQRFEIVTRATTDVIWDWDLRTDKLWWNENFQTVFGFTPEEVGTSSEGWKAQLHPADASAVLQSLHLALGQGETLWSAEYRFQRRDGTYAFIFDRGYILRDQNGAPVRMIGAMQDVSQRKNADAELEEAHRQLLETSRQAGMAEVATGVLHNVGNVLNSINVSATLVTEALRQSRVSSLGKVADLLRAQPDLPTFFEKDARAAQLPGYIAQLAAHLRSERDTMTKEVESLQNNIEHIKDIVMMQQSYAKISGVTETVTVESLVEDALRMNAAALARHDVAVVRDFADVPPVVVEKHKVLQILVNLIRNAKYACDEAQRPDKLLTLRTRQQDGDVRIEVIDNGVGVPQDNLTRIFAHGFTTRKNGHGFGLHSGALAAKELGGALRVHSDGPGRGATFTLELPLQPPGDGVADSSKSLTLAT